MARQVGGEGSTSEVPLPIRFAAEGDLTGILEIERLSFPDGKQWDSGDFQAALKDLFFVFLDGEISGFLIASCWEDTKRALILRIAVHPDYEIDRSRNREIPGYGHTGSRARCGNRETGSDPTV
jgi:hypothetical protein